MFRDFIENMFRGFDRKFIMLECLLFAKVQQGRSFVWSWLSKNKKEENTFLPIVNNPRCLSVIPHLPGLEHPHSIFQAKWMLTKPGYWYPQTTPSHFLLFIPCLMKGTIVLIAKSQSMECGQKKRGWLALSPHLR